MSLAPLLSARRPWRPSRRSGLVGAVNALLGQADRVPRGAARFLIAGGLSSLVNWLVRFPLSIAMPYGAAVGLAYAVGMMAGFGLYRSWVFPGSTLPLGSQIVRFVAVNLAGLSTVVVGAQVLVTLLDATGLLGLALAQAAGHGLAIVFGAVVNFAGHRAITFAKSAWTPRVAIGRASL